MLVVSPCFIGSIALFYGGLRLLKMAAVRQNNTWNEEKCKAAVHHMPHVEHTSQQRKLSPIWPVNYRQQVFGLIFVCH